MSVEIYTYGTIIDEVNKRLKGLSISDEVTPTVINSSLQTIVNNNLLYPYREEFEIEFLSASADTYKTVSARLPETIQTITKAWIEGRKEPVEIVSKNEAQEYINEQESGHGTVECSKVWTYEETPLTSDIQTEGKINLVSSSENDTSTKIYIFGEDTNGFSVNEEITLNGTTSIDSDNEYSDINLIYKSATMDGELTITDAGANTILDSLPKDIRLYKTRKVYANPVLTNKTIKFLGFRKVLNFTGTDDIPDFPPEFITQILLNRVLMDLTAWNKDSNVFQASQFGYQEGMIGLLKLNNILMSTEDSFVDNNQEPKYKKQ